MKENNMIEAEVKEVKTLNEKPKIDRSVMNKYCYICEKSTIGLRLKTVEEVGTLNICDPCFLNIEMEVAKEKYGGSTKEMLKQNAIAAGDKAKSLFGQAFNAAKKLFD